MELKNDERNDVIRQEEFKDIDVTNWYELVAILLLSAGGNFLLIKIFQRIQNLFLWKLEDPKNNPSKMLTVNCLLIITILYLFVLLLYSRFYFQLILELGLPLQNNIINYLTIILHNYLNLLSINIEPYILFLQQFVAQTMENEIKNRIEQISFRNNQYFINISFHINCHDSYSYYCFIDFRSIHYSLKRNIKYFFLDLYNYLINYCNIREYCLGALTMLSTVSFALICIILYSKLKDQYSVGDHYRTNLKFLSIAVIICTLLRPSFNFLFSQEFFWKMKTGLECKGQNDEIIISLPDQGFTWAIFQLIYSCITDFIPIYILSLLFSPNITKRKTLVVSDGWDTGLE